MKTRWGKFVSLHPDRCSPFPRICVRHCRRREFHLGLAPLIDSHVAAAKNKPLTADLAVPTFTKNVRVGHPKCGRARLSHTRGVGAEDRGSVRLRCMAPPDEAASSSGEGVIADVVLENPKPEKVFLSLD